MEECILEALMKDDEDFFSHRYEHICSWTPNEVACERYMWNGTHNVLIRVWFENSLT